MFVFYVFSAYYNIVLLCIAILKCTFIISVFRDFFYQKHEEHDKQFITYEATIIEALQCHIL